MKTTNVAPKIYDRNGNLTAYGFACGYVMRETDLVWLGSPSYDCKSVRKELLREVNTYFVSKYIDGKSVYAETFSTLKEAFKAYNAISTKSIQQIK